MHIVLKYFYTTWVRGVAYQKQLSEPKLMGVCARGACKTLWPPIYFCNLQSYQYQIWYTSWAWGVAYQKNLGPKLTGVGARGASKKFGSFYLFLQPLKLATSNVVYKLDMGSSLPRNNFQDQNWQGSGLGEHPKKIWDPVFIFAAIEACEFKFAIQLGLGQ